jgi:hypothetical protein
MKREGEARLKWNEYHRNYRRENPEWKEYYKIYQSFVCSEIPAFKEKQKLYYHDYYMKNKTRINYNQTKRVKEKYKTDEVYRQNKIDKSLNEYWLKQSTQIIYLVLGNIQNKLQN